VKIQQPENQPKILKVQPKILKVEAKLAWPPLTPLEFLKKFCSPKVMTWDTDKPKESQNYETTNGVKQQRNNDHDEYNDEYDQGRIKKVKRKFDDIDGEGTTQSCNRFQTTLDYKNKTKIR